MLGMGLGLALGTTAPQSGGASSVAVWTTTNGTAKSAQLTLSNANLTIQGTAGWGGWQLIAANIAGATKSEWSLTLTTLATDANNVLVMGLYNGTSNFTSAVEPGVGDSNGVAIQFTPGSTTINVFDATATVIGNFTLGTAVALGDKISAAVDESGSAGTHVLKIYRNGTLAGTCSSLTLTGFTTAFAGSKSNEVLTAFFGTPTSSGNPMYG